MKRSVRKLLSTCLAVAIFLTATPGWASEFHAVIANFGNAPRPSAHFDVSLDTNALAGSPIDVLFAVFKTDGSLLAEFAVPRRCERLRELRVRFRALPQSLPAVGR